MKLFLIIMCLLFGLLLASTQRVLLTSIQSFVVKEGMMARASRTAALPQLICSGSFCSYGPRSVLCKNVGHNGVDVNWQCEGEMTAGLRFDRIDVSCEGYAYPDDPYILADSCSVSYTLIGNPANQEVERIIHAPRNYPTTYENARNTLASRTMSIPPPTMHSPPPSPVEHTFGTEILKAFFGFVLFVGIVALVLFCMCFGMHGTSHPFNGGGGPGFWSGMGIGSIAGWSLASSNSRFSSSSLSRERTPSTTSIAYSGTTRKEEKQDYPATSIGYSGTSRKKEEKTTSSGVTTTTRR